MSGIVAADRFAWDLPETEILRMLCCPETKAKTKHNLRVSRGGRRKGRKGQKRKEDQACGLGTSSRSARAAGRAPSLLGLPRIFGLFGAAGFFFSVLCCCVSFLQDLTGLRSSRRVFW